MNCGADLIQAELAKKKELQEDSLAARRAAETAGGSAASGAAAGRAGPDESSEKTRLRIFDQQEGKRLVHERVSCYVTAGLVALPTVTLLIFGIVTARSVGLSQIPTLTLADLRSPDAFSDLHILSVAACGLGFAGLLAFVGLLQRGIAAGRAIREVKAGQKPTIVSLTIVTYWGLLLTALFCPPLGLIVAIALKFSSDEDIKSAAGTMIWVSLIVIAALIANVIPVLIQMFHPSAAQEGANL